MFEIACNGYKPTGEKELSNSKYPYKKMYEPCNFNIGKETRSFILQEYLQLIFHLLIRFEPMVKGSRPDRTGVIMLPRGDIGGLRRALVVPQRW